MEMAKTPEETQILKLLKSLDGSVSPDWKPLYFGLPAVALLFGFNSWFHSVFNGLSSDLSKSIVLSSALVSLAPLAFLFSKIYFSKDSRSAEGRKQKLIVYAKWVNFLRETIQSKKNPGKKIDEAYIQAFFEENNPDLFFYGSDDVVRTISNLKFAFFVHDPSENNASLIAYELIINTIRKDLGHKNEYFSRGLALNFVLKDGAQPWMQLLDIKKDA